VEQLVNLAPVGEGEFNLGFLKFFSEVPQIAGHVALPR